MSQESFRQTSSIIRRLRLVMLVIVVFIISCFLAFFVSSKNILEEIQNLYSGNNILNLYYLSIDKLSETEDIAGDVLMAPDVAATEIKFNKSLAETKQIIYESVNQSKNDPQSLLILNEAQKSLNVFEEAYKKIFDELKFGPFRKSLQQSAEFNSNLNAATRSLKLTKKELRKFQVNTKNKNNAIFASIYKNRFKPILVVAFFSATFLSFVIIFGLSITRRINRSVTNLLDATDHVGRGNLNYQAEILEHDEIGRLTNAFNKMISSLEIGQDHLSLVINRLSRLQVITASFSEALTPDQVFEVVFNQAFQDMEATTGSILIITTDKNFLELKRLEGYDAQVFEKWKRFPIDTDLPVTEVVNSREPLFTTSPELQKYTALDNKDKLLSDPYAIAFLPLVIENKSIGALTFSFPITKVFDQLEKDFMIALATQCAQAVYRSKLYEDAKKAIEVRDEFLSIASHELRTPLTPLKMQIQGVAKQINHSFDNLTPERILKMVETSERQINRLSTLIDDLLDVTRITSGKMSLNKEIFSLKEMITDVIAQYAQQFKKSQSDVELVIENDLTGSWDKVRIEQVVINLLINAAKYAPNKTIKASLTRVNKVAKIQITDLGPGIAQEDLERIFERFERVSDKQNIGGLGLGLYISKQIIEAHNGKIYVHSKLGHGSTFTVELPER